MQLTLDSCENGGPPPLPFSGGEERSLLQSQNGRGGERPPPPLPFSAGVVGTELFSGKFVEKERSPKKKKLSKMVPK